MGRGRGKGKKQSLLAAHDDAEIGEDEKLPVRRRGKPQKPLKDEIEEDDELEKILEVDEHSHDTKNSVLKRSTNNQENGRKRKRASQIKETVDSAEMEKGIGTKTNGSNLIKSVGYRHIGSRRKNTPKRAAEVGFDCKNRF